MRSILNEGDNEEAPPVIVVNETLARQHQPEIYLTAYPVPFESKELVLTGS